MFLLHKTRWEVFFGRNSGMYVLKRENFWGSKWLTYLFTQVYWIRVKAHLCDFSINNPQNTCLEFWLRDF